MTLLHVIPFYDFTLAQSNDTVFLIEDSDGNFVVPKPSVLALIGLGLAGIGYGRHRSKKAA
jgi:hypothetical protein